MFGGKEREETSRSLLTEAGDQAGVEPFPEIVNAFFIGTLDDWQEYFELFHG